MSFGGSGGREVRDPPSSKLVTFFLGEGHRFGTVGDAAGMDPEQCAIHFLREYQRILNKKSAEVYRRDAEKLIRMAEDLEKRS